MFDGLVPINIASPSPLPVEVIKQSLKPFILDAPPEAVLLKSAKLYEVSPCLKIISLLFETSKIKFFPSYGVIVKSSPLIEVNCFVYIFHDSLPGLNKCIIYIIN